MRLAYDHRTQEYFALVRGDDGHWREVRVPWVEIDKHLAKPEQREMPS